ncbi:hypothetical protein POM88_048866 [Heracleum sosnowskyi]|uniref:FBD domain-containing protein n=1 Tax=Heracleum sosnowskyi TaxID=360622 RepID=A0AAD8GUK1_9APIA|nr:hypothetical protein POM88_048866 [Heracleum sosnowskyi]
MHFKSFFIAIYRSCLTILDYIIFYQANPNSKEDDFVDFCEEDYEDCTLHHLEVITFSYFKGFKAELELVEVLLAHSPLLKTMFIHRDCDMEKDVAVKILEVMLEFPRASSRAQIKSLKLPFKADEFGQWVVIILDNGF